MGHIYTRNSSQKCFLYPLAGRRREPAMSDAPTDFRFKNSEGRHFWPALKESPAVKRENNDGKIDFSSCSVVEIVQFIPSSIQR